MSTCSGTHPHNPRRDTLIESLYTFLLPHLTRHLRDPVPSRLSLDFTGLLDPRLDRVDGSVGEGTYGTGDQTHPDVLPCRGLLEFGLVVQGKFLELCEDCEVCG